MTRSTLPTWGGRHSQRWTAATLATYGTTCHLCRQDGADTADHLIPRSRGGQDHLANLRPAHQACNSARRDMPLADWFAAHPVPRREPLAPSREW
jgi:5-methylcytosine-specific restriction endonuclease McrA